MLKDKSMPLYVITIGEFMELVREVVHSVVTENSNGNSNSITDDEHFTIAECAKFLKCSLVSIHKYKKQGLPYYKIGRKILFKKSEVLMFMKASNKRLHSFKKQK